MYQFVKNPKNFQDWNLTSQISVTRENPIYKKMSWGCASKAMSNELPVYCKTLWRKKTIRAFHEKSNFGKNLDLLLLY